MGTISRPLEFLFGILFRASAGIFTITWQVRFT